VTANRASLARCATSSREMVDTRVNPRLMVLGRMVALESMARGSAGVRRGSGHVGRVCGPAVGTGLTAVARIRYRQNTDAETPPSRARVGPRATAARAGSDAMAATIARGTRVIP